MNSKQTQKSGDGSTNLQAENIFLGVTYTEVKEIALDVFKNNFIKLSEDAADTATKRVLEFTEDFLSKLKSNNPDLLENVKDPALQSSIYEAQKAYAKTGDKDLFNMLINILLDRTKNSKRDLRQIVLDESLSVAPKLTQEQLDALTLIFIIKYSRESGLNNLDILSKSLQEEFFPFCSQLSKELSCYQHLEYVGCGSISVTTNQIENYFRSNYPGLFSNGFEKETFESQIGPVSSYSNLLTQCLRDSNKIQINALDKDVLNGIYEKENIPEDVRTKITQMFNQNVMAESDIKADLITRGDFMKILFDVWDNSAMKNMTITSVGISLAQANYHIKTGKLLDLSIWIK
jgi:hypothetical protein